MSLLETYWSEEPPKKMSLIVTFLGKAKNISSSPKTPHHALTAIAENSLIPHTVSSPPERQTTASGSLAIKFSASWQRNTSNEDFRTKP
jgi:hypothetical protein